MNQSSKYGDAADFWPFASHSAKVNLPLVSNRTKHKPLSCLKGAYFFPAFNTQIFRSTQSGIKPRTSAQRLSLVSRLFSSNREDTLNRFIHLLEVALNNLIRKEVRDIFDADATEAQSAGSIGWLCQGVKICARSLRTCLWGRCSKTFLFVFVRQ